MVILLYQILSFDKCSLFCFGMLWLFFIQNFLKYHVFSAEVPTLGVTQRTTFCANI